MLAVLFTGGGCATVVCGTRQKIQIITTPPGAKARVGLDTLTTPGVFSLSRKNDHTIEISKPGYEVERVHLNREWNHMVWGNILLLPLAYFGLVIDFNTGAGNSLRPDPVNVSLTAKRE
jgi:hypothetical protein